MDSDGLPQSRGSLNSRIVRGATWMVGLRFADHCIGFLSTIVLARLLVPADFGLIALAMAMIATITAFGEFGFELALIQNQQADRSHYDTAWTLGLLRGVVEATIIVAAAAPLAAFFEDPRLENVILALAVIPLLAAFSNIGTVAFRKELTFNKEFIFRIVPRIAGVTVTILFAIAWQSYWALATGMVAGRAVGVFMSYIMQSYRPRLSLAAWREIMNFSKWIVVIGIAGLLNRRSSTFLIAKFLDAASLGIYSIASQIANLASAELIAPIKQALFPAYARIAHDIPALRRAFLDAYGILVLVALPTAIGIGLTADYYVPLLLGPKWLGVVPLIEVLVISGGLRSLSSHVRPVYLAMNRPKLGAYASVGRAIIFLPLLYFGLVEYGLIGAAYASAAAHVAVLFCSLYYVHRLLGVTVGDLLRSSWRAIAACALMILAIVVLKAHPPVEEEGMMENLILLASAVATGVVAYVGTDLLLWWCSGRPAVSAEGYLIAYGRQALNRRRLRVGTSAAGEGI